MNISNQDHYSRKRIALIGTEISYVDSGIGDCIVFIHGNPTSSYLWRNVIPEVVGHARCLAPDLVGMGQSNTSPNGSYRFVDHVRYLDAWFDALGLVSDVTLVGHDWGSALAFYWAHRYPERVKGIAYMEAIVAPLTWDQWPRSARRVFQGMRSDAGEDMVLRKNVFIEKILPGSVMRALTDFEMEVYRKPFVNPGETRRPTLTWPREIPIGGKPNDVHQIAEAYSQWLASSEIPKLFVNAEPGAILIGDQREFCRTWPNQQEVTVKGTHFIQEDSPADIGRAISNWYRSI